MKNSLLFVVFFLLSLSLPAQIVNIENKRKLLNTDTTGWFGSTDMGFTLNENGKTVLTLTANAFVEYLQDKNRWLSLTNYLVVRANQEDFVNQGFQHLRYNRDWKERVIWEVFAQAQYNERLNLRFRGLLGTGLRFQLLDKKKSTLFLGTLYMFQYEEFSESGSIYRDNRLSSYLSYQVSLTENLTLNGTSYYQPLLTDLKIVRLSSQTKLLLKITQKLSFQSTFNISYDNRLQEEAEDVPAAIYSFINGLKWVF